MGSAYCSTRTVRPTVTLSTNSTGGDAVALSPLRYKTWLPDESGDGHQGRNSVMSTTQESALEQSWQTIQAMLDAGDDQAAEAGLPALLAELPERGGGSGDILAQAGLVLVKRLVAQGRCDEARGWARWVSQALAGVRHMHGPAGGVIARVDRQERA